MMATDRHTEDINEFRSSLGHCFEEADKALKDEGILSPWIIQKADSRTTFKLSMQLQLLYKITAVMN